MKEVKKVWGRELWIINCPEYCGKLLYLDEGAKSSFHCHRYKKETFFCLEGKVDLHINGKHYTLTPYSEPKTIECLIEHSFRGIKKSVILEIATHHDDNDVIRHSLSRGGRKGE